MAKITKEYLQHVEPKEEETYPPVCYLTTYWEVTLTVVFIFFALFTPLIIFVANDATFDLKTLELNEIGDYLAGVAAPIAFLWLVKGYYQQSKELGVNNKILALQHEELKNTVEAQNNQALTMKEQFDLLVREKYYPEFTITSFDAVGDIIQMQIKNDGHKIYSPTISVISDYVAIMDTPDVHNKEINVTLQAIEDYNFRGFEFIIIFEFMIELTSNVTLCYKIIDRPFRTTNGCSAEMELIKCEGIE